MDVLAETKRDLSPSYPIVSGQGNRLSRSEHPEPVEGRSRSLRRQAQDASTRLFCKSVGWLDLSLTWREGQVQVYRWGTARCRFLTAGGSCVKIISLLPKFALVVIISRANYV